MVIVPGSQPQGLLAMTAAPEALAVDAKSLATMLGVSVRTVRTMDAAGKLPNPLRLGRSVRWRVAEIQEWLADGAPDRQAWNAIRDQKKRVRG